ncbi:MAG: polysaccharide deacetylase family protein [Candidatus Woesearchaeota archaeon]
MKVYVSHDVDHLTIKEHLKDLVLPKYVILSLLELAKGLISLKTLGHKLKALCNNDGWNNLEELLEFNKRHGVKATVFIATRKGSKGLNYDLREAAEAFRKAQEKGFEVGVHGIAYEQRRLMEEELERARRITGKRRLGLRTHYLRQDEHTKKKAADIGYAYDATTYDATGSTRKGRIPLHPINLMDTYLFSPLKGSLTLEAAKRKTRARLRALEQEGEAHILLHQRHFNKRQFPRYHDWYVWLVKYCKKKGYTFPAYGGKEDSFGES